MAGGGPSLIAKIQTVVAGLMSQINITPFVDVVLVLLVIFMVTAPMLVKDILLFGFPKVSSGRVVYQRHWAWPLIAKKTFC